MTHEEQAVQVYRKDGAMPWAQQVMHVVRKDLLMSRWYALALAGVVTTLTVMAIDRGTRFDFTWAFLVVLTMMIGICLAVQGDSPTEPRAFWASRPLSPSAVAAAKALDIMLVVVAVRITAAIVLSVSEQSPIQLPGVIRDGVWLLPGFVAGAAMIAAVTTDLRSFLAAVVVVTVAVGTMLTYSLMFVRWPSETRSGLDLLFGVIAIGSLLVLFNTYRTRSTVLGAIGALFVFLFAQLTALAYAITSRPGV